LLWPQPKTDNTL